MSHWTVERPGTAADSGPAQGAASGRYLTVQLADETYALPVDDVTEILEYRRLTTVPMMPPAVRGIIDLRGRAVPVVDTSVRFGGPPVETGHRAAIVILQRGPHAVGILVDTVGAVIHLAQQDIEPSPDLGPGVQADVVSAMARGSDGRFIVIVNTTALLTSTAG